MAFFSARRLVGDGCFICRFFDFGRALYGSFLALRISPSRVNADRLIAEHIIVRRSAGFAAFFRWAQGAPKRPAHPNNTAKGAIRPRGNPIAFQLNALALRIEKNWVCHI